MVDEIGDRFYVLVVFLLSVASRLILVLPEFDVISEMAHILLAILVEVVAILIAKFNLIKIVFNALLSKFAVQLESQVLYDSWLPPQFVAHHCLNDVAYLLEIFDTHFFGFFKGVAFLR